MAEDFIENMAYDESVEKVGDQCFSYLLVKKFILPSRYDHICGEIKYKINLAFSSLLEKAYLSGDCLVVQDWKMMDRIPERLLHLSLVYEDNEVGIFDVLRRCKWLRTLLLLSPRGSKIDKIPRGLFLFLKSLKSLDLSRSNISALPDSICNITTLRYINLSETAIRWLPESFDKLCNLQTLNLKDCFYLVGLPNGFGKLTRLHHLILSNAHQLIGMPAGMGNLTNLRTLSAFIIGGDHGCSILELKHLKDISGNFCILRLENVTNSAEAQQVSLNDKEKIEKLELSWSALRDEHGAEEEKVLGNLQPHSLLKELKVLNYGGFEFPLWVGNPSFVCVLSITLLNCKNCRLLPSLGRLPSLKFLCIQKIDGVVEINRQFCGMSRSSCAFPKLEVLAISEMPNLKEWTEVENGDFPNLEKLTVDYCPELACFPVISNLKSLKHLELSNCQRLSFLPSQGVSPSLEVLFIVDCPILKEHWKRGEGESWPNITNVFSLWIDYEEMITD